MTQRYLIRYAYLGCFRGSTTRLKRDVELADPTSVQGNLELALLKLKPMAYPHVHFSSRTDAGVHALNAAAHVDLHFRRPFDCIRLANALNKIFNKASILIKINEIQRVRPDFESRHIAISRTYLYRVAFPKSHVDKLSMLPAIPIEELQRCYFSKFAVDMEKIKEAAKLFPGYHDFCSFKCKDRSHWKHSRRRLYSLDIKKSSPLTVLARENTEKIFDFWEFRFKGSGFVYNQIRRIIGTLEAVGRGRVTCEDIILMLQIPSHDSWLTTITCAPPCGLYLYDVEYNPKDLEYNDDDIIK